MYENASAACIACRAVSPRRGLCLVPLYDGTGALVNLQFINAEGLKRTLKGGQVKGACHLISELTRTVVNTIHPISGDPK